MRASAFLSRQEVGDPRVRLGIGLRQELGPQCPGIIRECLTLFKALCIFRLHLLWDANTSFRGNCPSPCVEPIAMPRFCRMDLPSDLNLQPP